MPEPTDTIAAIATAPGRGAIGVLRISGPEAGPVAARIAGELPSPRGLLLRDFRDSGGEVIDRGLVLRFLAPHSFTGEDVVELQAHGGPAVLGLLLDAACTAGARPARPGEFSERAFLNDRLDLAQAEAIADLIDAGSAAAVRAASRTLHGEFSRRVAELVEGLILLRAELEAALDFSDEEDVPGIGAEQLSTRLAALASELVALRAVAAQGRRLREGLTVAIVGQPNVGKSTLLNRLAGCEAAIVSAIPGTTRDVLREQILLEGLPIQLLDTAGMRETDDLIEQEGVRRAWGALAGAEVVLYLLDDSAGIGASDRELLQRIAAPPLSLLMLHNKCDVSGRPAGRFTPETGGTGIRLSAVTGAGIPELTAELRRIAGLEAVDSSVFAARARHLDALDRAHRQVLAAVDNAGRGGAPELVAEDLRMAQQGLDEITGRFTTEDLLGRIFSSFCIGK